jgi:CMP-N,N'-diacetyllegionaminic acid synthase
MKIYALIPARGGSKGIPRKNLYPVAGKPLLAHTITAAQDASAFAVITVSSDDKEILNLAQNMGVTGLLRPLQFSADDSSSDGVVEHYLKCHPEVQGEDVIVYLQPTSPLRTAHHITEALQKFLSCKAEMLLSVFIPDHHPFKSFKVNDAGLLEGAIHPDHPFAPRQSLPEVFLPNGAIYIFRVRSFLAEHRFPRHDLLPYLMPAELSIDIDVLADVDLVESRLETKR